MKDRVVDFFTSLKDDGIKKTVDRVKQSFNDNVLVHFKSKESIVNMVKSLKERLSLSNVTNRVNNFLESLNQRLFGLRKSQRGRVESKESKYWQEITGMPKDEFIQKLRVNYTMAASDYY